MKVRMISHAVAVSAASLALLFCPHDAAAIVFGLSNGNFATNGGAGQLTVNTTLSGWTGGGKEGVFGSATTPPVFVFTPGTATQLSSTGVNGDAFMGNVKFYSATAAPDNGVVVAADGDPDWLGSISQTVSGMTIGTPYTLTFNWAGAQQQGFSGSTSEQWQVQFGTATQSTSSVSTPSTGFAGWKSASLTFTPTATSQLLKFTAVGSPAGQTPWLLLDNVGLVQAPEPTSLSLLGISAVAMLGRRRNVRAG